MYHTPFLIDMNVLIARGFRCDNIKHISAYPASASAPLSAIRDVLSVHTASTDILLILEALACVLSEPAIKELLSSDPQFVKEENALFTSILRRCIAISSNLSLRSFALHPTKYGERFTSNLSQLH